MRIVQGLTWLQILLDSGPYLNLTSITQQHAKDSTLLGSLLDREEGFTGNPTIGYSFLVGLALTLSNDYVETIVAQVTSLTRSLNTVTDYCDYFILQYFTCFLKRELFAGDHGFDNATKIHLCHNYKWF